MRVAQQKQLSTVYDTLNELTENFQKSANDASNFEQRATLRAEKRGIPLGGSEILRRNTEQAQSRADDFAEAARLVGLYVSDSDTVLPTMHPDPRLRHPSASGLTPPPLRDAGS